MTDVLLFLSYTAAGWVRITLGLLLMWLLLSSRRPGAASLGLALAGAAALALLPLFFSLPAFYGVALETVWLVLCTSRFQGAPPRMGLFVGIFMRSPSPWGSFWWRHGWGFSFVTLPSFTPHRPRGRRPSGCCTLSF